MIKEFDDYLDERNETTEPTDNAILPVKEPSGTTEKVTKNNLTLGKMTYKGTWNASINTPTLGDSGAGGVKGDYYIISVAGSTSIDGITDWEVGDWTVNNGATWDKIDNSEPSVPLNKFDATTDPGVGDDSNDGYSVGSRWINVTDDKTWECLDASVGAANWTQTNGGGSGGVSFGAGVIKDPGSTYDGTIIDTISDWSGSAGAYTSTITFVDDVVLEWIRSLVFYEIDVSSDYIQVVPSEVKVTGTKTVVVTMPTDDDLYLGSL